MTDPGDDERNFEPAPRLSDANQVVLHCARRIMRAGYDGPLSAGDADWEAIRRAAKRHQVLPLLHEAFREGIARRGIPPAGQQALLVDHVQTGMRNEIIARRLHVVLDRLQHHGVEVMLLKGAILAYSTYPRPEQRGMNDVDLLVRETEFPVVRAVLESVGYRARIPAVPVVDLPRFAQCFRQIRFIGGGPPDVEVHFRLFNFGLPSPVETAWQDAAVTEFRGVRVRCPSPERFLLHLCLHAQQHGFAVLRLFLDIALWMERQRIDPDEAIALSSRHGLRTAAYYALTCTDRLLGPLCGNEWFDRLRPKRLRRRLTEHVWKPERILALEGRLGPSEAELPRAYLMGEASIADKLLYVKQVLFPPSSWSAVEGNHANHTRLARLRRVWAVARRSALAGN